MAAVEACVEGRKRPTQDSQAQPVELRSHRLGLTPSCPRPVTSACVNTVHLSQRHHESWRSLRAAVASGHVALKANPGDARQSSGEPAGRVLII